MDTLLQETIDVTRAAGAAIMRFYQSAFEVTHKKPENPVTDADIAADTILRERLLALLPTAGWLSEETADSPDRLTKTQVWQVDPLDGTKEFVLGLPEFAVSVALVEDGRPILGVIYGPASNELFYGCRGRGVFYNDQPVGVSRRPALEGARVDASRSERKRGEFAPFEELVSLHTMGSIAYKLARIAAGHTDATWSRGPKHEWDVCAGVLLVEEAGGCTSNLDDQQFTFNRAKPLVNGIIADNGRLHGQIVAALAPHRDTARAE